VLNVAYQMSIGIFFVLIAGYIALCVFGFVLSRRLLKSINKKLGKTYSLGATPFGRTLEVVKLHKALYPRSNLGAKVIGIQTVVCIVILSVFVILLYYSFHMAS
jgi:hypothetical protein